MAVGHDGVEHNVRAEVEGGAHDCRAALALSALRELLGMGSLPPGMERWDCGYEPHGRAERRFTPPPCGPLDRGRERHGDGQHTRCPRLARCRSESSVDRTAHGRAREFGDETRPPKPFSKRMAHRPRLLPDAGERYSVGGPAAGFRFAVIILEGQATSCSNPPAR